MENFSKFKALTVMIILLFIFAVAAMYTNTKEAADKTAQNNNKIAAEQSEETFDESIPKENISSDQFQKLSQRVDAIENTMSSVVNSNSSELKCSIKGILNNGELVPLSSQDAINESKMSEKEIVITCNFNQ